MGGKNVTMMAGSSSLNQKQNTISNVKDQSLSYQNKHE